MLRPSALRHQAAQHLERSAYSPKKLVLLHTALALGSFLLTALINYLLSLQIADTGGLSGMELVSALTAAQSVLELAVTVGLPFWNIGLYFAACRWAEGQTARPADLLQGFVRFRSALGFFLLKIALFFVLAVGITNISSVIFMMTPFATPLIDQLTPLLQQGSGAEILMTDAVSDSLLQALIPLLIFSAVLFALVAIPLFYRLRFSEFALMSGLTCGKALLKSFAVTRKNCLQILKLDLSYWWYYLGLGLCMLISNGDWLLSLLGISLPLSATAAYFVFYPLGLMCQGLLLWQWESRRMTVYCLAYRSLASEETDTAGDSSANSPV